MSTETDFAGRVVATDRVMLTSEATGMVEKVTVRDEYTVRPGRIRVAPGATVTWTNNGAETHEVMALDGSWTSGPIPPGGTASHRFKEAGRYTYICRNHPWTYGQVIVEAK